MNIDEMMALPDEELHEISMQKKKNGCATKEALKAQRILWERNDRNYSKYGGSYLGYGNSTSKVYED